MPKVPDRSNESDPRTPGAILRARRETAGLSVDQVADRLYLLCSVIRHLELDNYERIRGETFVRGYLRNYARLLGLSPDKLLSRYDAMSRTRVPSDLLPESRSRRISRGASRLGSLALLLGIGALPITPKREVGVESTVPATGNTHIEAKRTVSDGNHS